MLVRQNIKKERQKVIDKRDLHENERILDW